MKTKHGDYFTFSKDGCQAGCPKTMSSLQNDFFQYQRGEKKFVLLLSIFYRKMKNFYRIFRKKKVREIWTPCHWTPEIHYNIIPYSVFTQNHN
jgi:hypothetical protein